MLKKSLKASAIVTVLTLLTGCSGMFDTDNTPKPKALESIKVEFTPVSLWSTSVGKNSDNWLKQSPALENNVLYTTSDNGDIYAINASNGQTVWHHQLTGPFASGPAASHGTVIVANRAGKVSALDAINGSVKWTQDLASEVLGSPAVNDHVAIIKSSDGEIHAFNKNTGVAGWTFRQTEPTLALHSAGTPRFQEGYLYAGFANGNLVKLNAASGQASWIKAVAIPEGAFAIERMIDIDADPAMHGNLVFAASFQGKIAAFEAHNGSLVWSHALSSYTGMTTDGETLYITDASGSLWAFNAHSGQVRFQKTDLLSRGLSAPALIGNYVVVGDKLGYLHWFNKQDGRIVARISLGSAIQATPLVENNRLFVLTQNGRLHAYKL